MKNNRNFGHGEDISGCFVELAREGYEKNDNEAKARLLFNHEVVFVFRCGLLKKNKDGTFPYLWRIDKYAERYGRSSRTEPVDDANSRFIQWVMEKRFDSMYNTASAYPDWQEFLGVLCGGDTLPNLLASFFNEMLGRGALDVKVLHDREDVQDSREDVARESAEAAATMVAGKDEDNRSEFHPGSHAARFEESLLDVVYGGKDREMALALTLLTLPYFRIPEESYISRLQQMFPSLPESFEAIFGEIVNRYRENVRNLENKIQKQTKQREQARADLLKLGDSPMYSDNSQRQAEELEEKVDKLLGYISNNAKALRHLHEKFVSESDLMKLLGLESPEKARDVRKRAVRKWKSLLNAASGRDLEEEV